MFRICAHIYHNQFDKIVRLSLEAHWNSFFAHFISFGKTYDLAEAADLVPLMPPIEALEQQGKIAI
jgi:Mob1/phocein family